MDLLHALVENAHATTVPAYPDLVTDQFGGDFIEGASHFDITVAMDAALGFFKAGKKRVGQRLEMSTLLFKTGCDLLACCSVNAFVCNLAFPLLEKEVFFTQGFEPSPLERVGAHIADSAFYFALVLGLVRPAWHHMESIVSTEVC